MCSLKKIFLIFFFLVLHIANAQEKISGTVTDAETQEPLAFVNIIINHTKTSGTITDIDGKFLVDSPNAINSLTFSYIGFETKTITVHNQEKINITLSPAANQLEQVIISSGENPALRIIRKAIANRESNNPENIASFEYTSYNKVVFDYINENPDKPDSIFQKVFKGGHLFMMESVTKKKSKAPNKSEETVIGNRVSGFKNPYFVTLATNMQPFSFYKENINLLNINFLNPISDGALKKYDYELKKTIFKKNDTIHLISFQPKSSKNFEGLKGILYINTENYAIQNVIASPAKKEGLIIDLQIQQQYQYIENKAWFPEQLNYELTFNNSSNTPAIKAEGKSYIKNVNLNPALEDRDFSAISVKIDDDSNKKDSLFWKKYRSKNLTEKDSTTYKVLDSIGKKYKFDHVLSYFEKLPQGKFPIGVVDVDLTKSFIYNRYEGFRLGTGLYTNEKLFKKLSFGGYFGYGLKDYQWKYGLSANYEFSKTHESFIKAGYRDDLFEIGTRGLKNSTKIFSGLRDFLVSKVDHIQHYEIETGFRTLDYLNVNLSFKQQKITPQKNYGFKSPTPDFPGYHNSEVSVKLRYAYNEKIVESPFQNIKLGTDYPVFTVDYSHGFRGVFQSDLSYNKLEARVEQSFFSKNIGTTSYRLQAGYIDKKIPIGLLFTGEGSYDKKFPYVMENTFQTMKPYEFLSNRYVDLFFKHNFGSLLFKVGNFKPNIIIHQNLGWGNLFKNGNRHTPYFKTMENIYMESGLGLEKILKINYLNVGYLGFGAGVFYRYGAYHLNDFNDDIAFKLNFSFSFN